jgi:hypothetical protein
MAGVSESQPFDHLDMSALRLKMSLPGRRMKKPMLGDPVAEFAMPRRRQNVKQPRGQCGLAVLAAR